MTILKLKDTDEVDLKVLGIDFDQILVLSLGGSHMYGTSTKDSDRDYFGLYLPTRRQLLLNDYPKQVTLPKEYGLDFGLWSIHYFLKLACQGETLSIDLLHAPTECLVVCDDEIWYDLVGNRKRFYDKNMKAFVSYARKQAAKYGLKGDRMNAIETVIKYLKNCSSFNPFHDRLKDVWDNLPKGDHIHILDTEPIKMYQVCGKKFQETVNITYILEQLEKSLTEYGRRAKLAKDNQGVDWKAVSHALRACDQVYDILKYGDYEYPLRTSAFLRNVKLGKYDFITVVQPALEDGMDDLEKMFEDSDLPDAVDKEYWKQWVIDLMQNHVL